ncbi:hypothetical protein HUJ04_001780 [Dendroctonus ponderosae]|uniref:Uncharacterized protein n=1 Tax=Dendroctonus ponderosae TaxID=77166 RepID=A0AAR5P6B3_DENPD|nr:hypothetical protein HUJ04_001780 [Dendroctonus ponderosae]
MKLFLLTLVALGSTALGVPLSNNVDSNEVNTDSDFVTGLNKCAFQSDADGIVSCATERIVRSLDLLAAESNVEILPGVSLLSDGSAMNFRSGKQLKEELLEVKSNKKSMLDLVANATSRFFAGRTLKVKLPSSEEIGRALEEGRKRTRGGNKNKGGMNMSMMGIGAAIAGLVPLFLGKVALITAKALIVGKIALVLSAILLIQMFRSGSRNTQAVESIWSSAPPASYGAPSNVYGPPATSYGVPSSQYPYSRSFNADNQDEQLKYSQQLAYSEQRK